MREEVWIDGRMFELRTAHQEELIRRCWDAVRVVFRGQEADANDFGDELLWKVLRSEVEDYDRFMNDDQFLVAAARNIIRDHLRKVRVRTKATNLRRAAHLRRHTSGGADWDVTIEDRRTSDPAHVVAARIDAASFVQVIRDGLTEGDLAVFDFDPSRECTAALVGQSLGMTEKAVRQSRYRIARAIESIQEQITRRHVRIFAQYGDIRAAQRLLDHTIGPPIHLAASYAVIATVLCQRIDDLVLRKFPKQSGEAPSPRSVATMARDCASNLVHLSEKLNHPTAASNGRCLLALATFLDGVQRGRIEAGTVKRLHHEGMEFLRGIPEDRCIVNPALIVSVVAKIFGRCQALKFINHMRQTEGTRFTVYEKVQAMETRLLRGGWQSLS